MRGIWEITLISRDMEFLKYVVSNHSVDVNGKYLGQSFLCKVLGLVHNTLTNNCPANSTYLSLTTAPVTKQGESPLAVAVCERNLDMIKCLVKECNANVNGGSSV